MSRDLIMSNQQEDFTQKYKMKIRPSDGFGAIAALFLIFTPLLNPYVTVCVGIVLLILLGFCHFPKKK